MEITKELLVDYLKVIVAGQEPTEEDVIRLLEQNDKETYVRLLKARIKHLQSQSGTGIFSDEHYSGTTETLSQILKNLNQILSNKVREDEAPRSG